MTDFIHIDQFKTQGLVGILAWELQCKQTLSLDIDYPVDCRASAAVDDIQSTCNYSQLTQEITEFLDKTHFGLLETLAEKLSAHLLTTFSLPWIKLTIRKLGAIHQANHVAVHVERTKNE